MTVTPSDDKKCWGRLNLKTFFGYSLFLLFFLNANSGFSKELSRDPSLRPRLSPQQPIGDFNGDWQQPCFSTEDDDWLQADLRIHIVPKVADSQDLQIIWTRNAFEEANCKKMYLEYSILYKALNFSEPELPKAGIRTGETKVTDIDLEVEKVFYIVRTEEVARALNLVAFCGLKNWKLGSAQEVSGKDCDGFHQPLKNSRIFSRVGLETSEGSSEGLRLKWGRASKVFDGSSLQLRFQDFEDFSYQKFIKKI